MMFLYVISKLASPGDISSGAMINGRVTDRLSPVDLEDITEVESFF